MSPLRAGLGATRWFSAHGRPGVRGGVPRSMVTNGTSCSRGRSDTPGGQRSADFELPGGDADVDLHQTVDDADGVSVHREDRGKRADFAALEVEPRAVAGAFDLAVFELSFAEHAAVVRAYVVDRAPRAVRAVTEAEALRAGVDDPDLTGRHLVLAGDRDERAHASTPISAMLPIRGRRAFRTRWRTCSSASWLMTRRKNPWTRSCCAASRSNPRDMT